MSMQSEMPITSFPRPLKSYLHRFLLGSSSAWKCLCWEELGVGLGLCKTCWAERGEPQLISWLGACTWSLAEAVILKLLLHKHSPYQSGLVAQESVTLAPLAEGSKAEHVGARICTEALTLVFLTAWKWMKGKCHPTWRDCCQHTPCSASPTAALLVTANMSNKQSASKSCPASLCCPCSMLQDSQGWLGWRMAEEVKVSSPAE